MIEGERCPLHAGDTGGSLLVCWTIDPLTGKKFAICEPYPDPEIDVVPLREGDPDRFEGIIPDDVYQDYLREGGIF